MKKLLQKLAIWFFRKTFNLNKVDTKSMDLI